VVDTFVLRMFLRPWSADSTSGQADAIAYLIEENRFDGSADRCTL